MNNFTYSIPTKIHFGKGQISHLSELSESGNKVLLCYGGGSIKKAGIYDEAVKILKEEDMEIFELSGGEKQRAAICRALMNHSDLILADEPTGNLDSASSETVMEYLQMINKDLKKAVVLVTHDAYVASFCDRVIFVKDGNIEVELRKKEKQDVFCDKIMKAQKDILKNK